jgi:hypothetical protein
MRQSYRPDIPPKPQPYRTQILDPLGLVAGMIEEFGITKAMILNGLGFVNQQLYPTFRRPSMKFASFLDW